jgi:hypothetical protein
MTTPVEPITKLKIGTIEAVEAVDRPQMMKNDVRKERIELTAIERDFLRARVSAELTDWPRK